MQIVAKIVVLLVVAVAAFAIHGYAQHYTAVALFPVAAPRPVSQMLVCAAVGAVAASIAAAFPLAAVFRRGAWLAAVVVAAPVLALRIRELVSYSGPLSEQVKIMALAEAGSYVVALVFFAWFVSHRWPRPSQLL